MIMKLSQIKKILKLRPLTAKEKAVLWYWNHSEGRITKTTGGRLSDMVLSFCDLYTEQELETILLPFASMDEYDEFHEWLGLTSLTLDHDLKSQIFFNETLSLLNERAIFLHQQFKSLDQEYYSISLDQNTDLIDIYKKVNTSFFMFYYFLIGNLIKNILFSNAFKLPDDLLCVKSLIKLTNIRKSIETEDSRVYVIEKLMEIYQEQSNLIISDHINYLAQRFSCLHLYRQDLVDKISQDVIKIMEIYYPTKPVPKSKEDTIFSEVNEFTQTDT